MLHVPEATAASDAFKATSQPSSPASAHSLETHALSAETEGASLAEPAAGPEATQAPLLASSSAVPTPLEASAAVDVTMAASAKRSIDDLAHIRDHMEDGGMSTEYLIKGKRRRRTACAAPVATPRRCSSWNLGVQSPKMAMPDGTPQCSASTVLDTPVSVDLQAPAVHEDAADTLMSEGADPFASLRLGPLVTAQAWLQRWNPSSRAMILLWIALQVLLRRIYACFCRNLEIQKSGRK